MYLQIFNLWAMYLHTYRELELRLKKDVQFTPTNTGRTVNYIFRNLHYKKND